MRGKDIRIAGIRKDFGATSVLKGIDLDVRQGEFLTLLGPSGCGKSTLLRLIAGFDLPTSGSLEIGGREVTYLVPKKREIAMVFQSYALYPHMTARRNISIPLEMQRLSFSRNPAVKAALRAAGFWLENRAYGQSYAQGFRTGRDC